MVLRLDGVRRPVVETVERMRVEDEGVEVRGGLEPWDMFIVSCVISLAAIGRGKGAGCFCTRRPSLMPSFCVYEALTSQSSFNNLLSLPVRNS